MAKGIQTAGEFIIEELRLVTTSGLEVDLITSVVGLTLFEDIFSMTISGTIAIADSVNLASYGPLLGQEYLHLKISTPTFKDESAVIDFSKNAFLVHSISNREKITGGVQGFVLSFVSQELVRNQRLKVTQSLTDTWSNIVKKMLTGPAYIDTKKKIDLEPTAGVKKFVAPNIRPLDIIVLGMKQAVSEFKGEPTYLFYETLKGFNFRTLASLYNNAPQLDYITVVPGSNPVALGIKYNILNEMRTVLNYEIVSNNDSIANYRAGMFGSKLITHDIISKSYETKVYNYHDNFKKESHIVGGVTAETPEFPLASALALNDKGLRVSDFFARTFMMPTSLSGDVDSQHTTKNNTNPYMAYDPHKWLQRRNSQMIQLENALQVNIMTHGNTLINAGDKVILNLPYTATKQVTGVNEKFDKFYKGPFLIKRIRHDFIMNSSPKRHRMYMSLVKDSLEEELEISGPIEPSSDKTAEIIEYTY
ncbi:hypothetical protein CMI47_06280 [Candidatus Pacearchaeota archaeon]|nr:hypothetical protein [Candidatus Pacearchaeota archaeon]